jgi:hypothetical protein
MTQLAAVLSLAALLISVAAGVLSLAATIRVNALSERFPNFESGLRAGSDVPTSVLLEVLDRSDLDRFVRGPTAAIFISADCPPCRELVAKLHDTPEPNRAVYAFEDASSKAGIDRLPSWLSVVSDPDRRVQRAFKVVGTPQTFLIKDSKVESNVVGSNTDWLDGEHVTAPLKAPLST